MRVLLLLSHGQASVERGFSTNREALADNLAQHTLVAKRQVKDYIGAMGGSVTGQSCRTLLFSIMPLVPRCSC